MSSGKAIAQAGHAYIGALRTAQKRSPAAFLSYTSLTVGTKICLDGGTQQKILNLHDRLLLASIPSFLVYDSGHIEPPHFDGRPILTALGVGPLSKSEAPGFLKKLKLWTGSPDQGGVP